MRYATSIYIFLTQIHYLCFIFLTLTYVQALDVGAWKCPGDVAKSDHITGTCINSKSTDCQQYFGQNVTNCVCYTFSKNSRGRISCYCCKVKS
uniref:S-locus pollen protein 11-2 n=2 Tax=Raphanus sativus TaxID=3726 RepID=Q6TGF4_RAPSA|nr:S-locus pollen protein 11-2 [Raphanus sativus]